MSEVAIAIENLGKKYRIRHQTDGYARYKTLREVVSDRVKRLFHNPQSAIRNPQSREDFWALRNVSFEIKPGEVIGIIGRNGAGKSTLLKVLSRITEPTTGRVRINGRVGSLLEVGTGFHPELTGRENVFLNGAILGMTKAEIRRKFDEIVAFAEVERFLDTPVKRYSSGMYVRLAFAVAAHLDPEILLVDEVLAVGDAAFQKKCLGKMGEASRGGRTVLFVSHNMAQISRICKTCLMLDQGLLKLKGPVAEVTAQYLMSANGQSGERIWEDRSVAPGDEVARLQAVRVISEGIVTDVVNILKPVILEMEFWNDVEGANLLAAFTFITSQGVIAFVTADLKDPTWGGLPRPRGLYRVRCVIPGKLFNEGLISVVAEVSTRTPVYQVHFLEFDCVAFHVVDSDSSGSLRNIWARDIPGTVRPMEVWENWSSDYIGSDAAVSPMTLARET